MGVDNREAKFYGTIQNHVSRRRSMRPHLAPRKMRAKVLQSRRREWMAVQVYNSLTKGE